MKSSKIVIGTFLVSILGVASQLNAAPTPEERSTAAENKADKPSMVKSYPANDVSKPSQESYDRTVQKLKAAGVYDAYKEAGFDVDKVKDNIAFGEIYRILQVYYR